ncbi:MAG: acyl-CoA dehydratase activase [Deltaproteobacteria bacterium]|nr:acyl-CoA dehydratase activase [Deltaproteobacteria bacterium]
MDKEIFFAGIDVGSVSLNAVVINRNREIVYEAPYERHLGKVNERVLALIEDFCRRFGKHGIRTISFTGNHGKELSERLNTPYEFETISQVLGTLFVEPEVRTIISMGGQETALFQINRSSPQTDLEINPQSNWELAYFNTNGPCASGTGSFIDQQAQRLATSMYSREVDTSQTQLDRILKDFILLGKKSVRAANVACRCTVFTKSDMIHLQNRGEKLEDIIYGLHVGNARNYVSTIVSNRRLEVPVAFVGGMSLNELQVKALKEYIPDLHVPPHSTSVGALGVALSALSTEGEEGTSAWPTLPDLSLLRELATERRTKVPVAKKLTIVKTVFPETNEIKKRSRHKPEKVFLGIDIGSTTTKYALINEAHEIVGKNYVPTKGKPIEVTQALFRDLLDESGDQIEIIGTATTGSGRNVVGDFLNVDLIIDEITAHARGAVEIDPTVDTLFEIGGQDSKYVSISNTYPLDFDMNKVCAAGTGSFLHELANKYGISIVEEFQNIALSSDFPVKLAERCTVFMESDLVSYHQKGVATKDLIAGLCYAIVYNYLNRVVEKRKVGDRVMFLGGPSLNKGVVAAFENVLGKPLIVPRHREVLGAYGAAISVHERMRLTNQDETGFRGLESAVEDRMAYAEKICRADSLCHNQCKLKIYDFDGRKSIWGGECGRYELTRNRGVKETNFFALRKEIWETYMNGVYETLPDQPLLRVDERPTVGMQRALYGQQDAILWAHFFDHLGYRLVLTPPTNAHLSSMGIESMTAETCYPVKVSHGHVKELVGKTAFLFLPSVVDMGKSGDKEKGFYCPMVQSNSYMVRIALELDMTNVLNPVVHLKYDVETLALELVEQLRPKLPVTVYQIRDALYYALGRQNQFQQAVLKKGSEILKSHPAGKPLVVVTGRPYNLYDERLNLRLGHNLAKIGVMGLPMDFLDVSSVDLSDFPSMYWGLGARILRAAKITASNPDFFGLHLTNFGCGADSFLEHFYRHIMGEKAYMILELDEHSAVAGVMTRLEAYKNVIFNSIEKGHHEMKEPRKLAN